VLHPAFTGNVQKKTDATSSCQQTTGQILHYFRFISTNSYNYCQIHKYSYSKSRIIKPLTTLFDMTKMAYHDKNGSITAVTSGVPTHSLNEIFTPTPSANFRKISLH